MTGPKIRLATHADVPALVTLESRYFIENVPADQRHHGFISAQHSPQWFHWAIRNCGVHIAVNDEQELVGFIAVTPPPPADAQLPAVLQAIQALVDEVVIADKPISAYNYAYRGPVLITESARGRGLYAEFNKICHEFYRDRYEIGVLFVSAANPKSLHTTTTKLGATVLREFEAAGQRYHLLAFKF